MTEIHTHDAVGVKPFTGDINAAAWLVRLMTLFCLEKDGCPAGILPLAFSDMPRSCKGTVSSIEDDIDGVRELCREGEE